LVSNRVSQQYSVKENREYGKKILDIMFNAGITELKKICYSGIRYG
jgi:hypothetical protein